MDHNASVSLLAVVNPGVPAQLFTYLTNWRMDYILVPKKPSFLQMSWKLLEKKSRSFCYTKKSFQDILYENKKKLKINVWYLYVFIYDIYKKCIYIACIYTLYLQKMQFSYTCVYIHIYRFFEKFIYSVYIYYI